MKRIYFVRHGETNNNAGNLSQDSTAPLSENGVKQAKYIAERLKHVKFDNLLASDFVRAEQTAEVVAKVTAKSLVIEPLLREFRRPSELVGVSKSESVEYKEFLRLTDENVSDPEWRYSDEENFFDILKRVNDFLKKVDSFDGDTVAVSHTRFISVITLHVIMGMRLTPEEWRDGMNNVTPTNTGITVLEYHEEYKKWKLLTFNDHAHFAE